MCPKEGAVWRDKGRNSPKSRHLTKKFGGIVHFCGSAEISHMFQKKEK